MKTPDTRNHLFTRTGDYSYASVGPLGKKELEALTARANALDTYPDMRSCWQCNPAHSHFLDGPWESILACFSCGRFYFENADITVYVDEQEAPT